MGTPKSKIYRRRLTRVLSIEKGSRLRIKDKAKLPKIKMIMIQRANVFALCTDFIKSSILARQHQLIPCGAAKSASSDQF